jgi:hypothetical protein
MDNMMVFRQIIGHIARIDDRGWVEVKHVAQDMDIDIVDLRVWLRLMDMLGLVAIVYMPEMVLLRLLRLDFFGFDTTKLKDL